MSDFGLAIYGDDGNTRLRIDKNTAGLLNYIGTIKIKHNSGTGTTYRFNLGFTAGSTALCIPRDGVQVGTSSSTSPYNDQVYAITGWSRSGNTITFTVNPAVPGIQGGVPNGFTVDVYEYNQVPEAPSGHWGISVQGMRGYTEINDTMKLGYCVYAQKLNVSNGWTLPSNIPGSNKRVFCYWNNASAVVEMGLDNVIRLSGVTTLEIYICVFASDFTLQLDSWGLAIWNDSGRLVFSSKYAPFNLGASVSISNDYKDSGVLRPMVPLERSAKTGTRSGTVWTIYNMGLQISGRQIRRGRGTVEGTINTGGVTLQFPNISTPSIVLDASDYFKF